MFLCEKGFPNWVKYMHKPGALHSSFSIVFGNGRSLRSVPDEWSASCVVDVCIELSKGVLGVRIGEFGGFVC